MELKTRGQIFTQKVDLIDAYRNNDINESRYEAYYKALTFLFGLTHFKHFKVNRKLNEIYKDYKNFSIGFTFYATYKSVLFWFLGKE